MELAVNGYHAMHSGNEASYACLMSGTILLLTCLLGLIHDVWRGMSAARCMCSRMTDSLRKNVITFFRFQ